MDRSPRLAELVLHLTGCTPRAAVSAVDAASVRDRRPADSDALTIVARAMCSVRRVDLREPLDLRDPSEVNVQ